MNLRHLRLKKVEGDVTDDEYEIQKRAVDNDRRDERLLERLRLYWVECFIIDQKGDRVVVLGREKKVLITVHAENRKQAKRLFEEVETPSHELISLMG